MVKIHRTVIIPHLVAGLFLASSNGITPRYYFETVYTQLQNEGKDGECLASTQFFQIAITHTGTGANASALETTEPAAPAQNPNLIRHQLELL